MSSTIMDIGTPEVEARVHDAFQAGSDSDSENDAGFTHKKRSEDTELQALKKANEGLRKELDRLRGNGSGDAQVPSSVSDIPDEEDAKLSIEELGVPTDGGPMLKEKETQDEDASWQQRYLHLEAKYLAVKRERDRMLSAVEGPPRGVQIKKEDAEGPAWDRSREEAGGSSVTDGSMENFNPAHFTAQLPPAMRLPGPSMSINYRKTIKLFFKAEKTLRDLCAPQGFLELSGRMIWAHEGSQHAFALSSPFKTDNNVQDRSLEKDLWPGQIREVFFRKNKTTEPFWSYAGTYKCHKLPPMTAAEYIALDEATRNSLLFSAFPDSPIHQELAATIDDLYRQGILKIQRIGLQYLGFNQNLYVAMKLISEQRHSAGAGPSSSGSKRQVGDGDGDEKPRKKAKNKRRAGGGSGAYT